MKKDWGPEMHALFISHTFIKIAKLAIYVFLRKSSLFLTRGKSSGYRPTGSAGILSTMYVVKYLLSSGRVTCPL
jgi:hypothetical protein